MESIPLCRPSARQKTKFAVKQIFNTHSPCAWRVLNKKKKSLMSVRISTLLRPFPSVCKDLESRGMLLLSAPCPPDVAVLTCLGDVERQPEEEGVADQLREE